MKENESSIFSFFTVQIISQGKQIVDDGKLLIIGTFQLVSKE